jgi:hypothetical protein
MAVGAFMVRLAGFRGWQRPLGDAALAIDPF